MRIFKILILLIAIFILAIFVYSSNEPEYEAEAYAGGSGGTTIIKEATASVNDTLIKAAIQSEFYSDSNNSTNSKAYSEIMIYK